MALPVTCNTKELKLFSVHQIISTIANKVTLAVNQRQEATAIRLQKGKNGWNKSTAACWVGTAGTTHTVWISGSEHFATPVQLRLSKLGMETGLCPLVPSALTADSSGAEQLPPHWPHTAALALVPRKARCLSPVFN